MGRTSAAGLVLYALALIPGLFPLHAAATPLVNLGNSAPNQALLGETQEPWSNPVEESVAQHDTIYPDPNSDKDVSESTQPPSWFTSTLMARRLLALSTTGVASTIFPSTQPPNTLHAPPSPVAGVSIPLPEYYADCDEALPPDTGHGGDGNPIFLALRVSTTFRNAAAGSNISLSIDWWNHLNDTQPLFPGFPLSAAGLPRVTLFGYVEPFDTPVPEDTEAALRECHVSAHPDSEVWLPGRPGSPHSSYWARMVVTQVYWIGGFGGYQQIGWLNVTEWKGIRREGSLPGVGDGRGWADVRLPGEKE